MGLFGTLFAKKEEKATHGGIRDGAHSFDDMDRVHATTMRRYNQELKKIQLEMQRLEMKKQLQDLKDELNDSDIDDDSDGNDGSMEAMLMQVMTPMLLNKGGESLSKNTPPLQTSIPNKPPVQEITDDEIRDFLDSLGKKEIQLGKTMPKTMVYRYVTQRFPMTMEEFERAYKILKEEY